MVFFFIVLSCVVDNGSSGNILAHYIGISDILHSHHNVLIQYVWLPYLVGIIYIIMQRMLIMDTLQLYIINMLSVSSFKNTVTLSILSFIFRFYNNTV